MFRRSLVLSAIVHAALLAAFSIYPLLPHHPVIVGPLVVSLITPAESAPEAPASQARAEPRAQTRLKPEAKPEKRRPAQTEIAKTQESPSAAKTQATVKPEPEQVPETVSETRPGEVPSSPADGGPLSVARVDEPFAYDYYLEAVIGRISEKWAPPAGVSAQTTVTVRFRIMPQGRVYETAVEGPSAIPFFDRSAQDAIMRAQPFPPFPPAYRGRWLTLHLKFVYGG